MSDSQSGTDGLGDASIATQAQQKVQRTTHEASRTASRYVREQTETRSKQAAGELQVLAGALRRSSHSLHADGKSTTANGIESVVDRIEGVGRYLEQSGGDKMLRDLEAFGRRKPWGMIGLGLGVGVAASRFLKASSSRRFQESQQQVVAYGPGTQTAQRGEAWSPAPAEPAVAAANRGS